MTIGKKDVVKPKIFTIRQEADSEVAIHAIKEIVDDSKTETVLLIHAENAFNSINRKVPLHNTEFTFVYNCNAITARLFSIGGEEIRSREGTIQADPPALTRDVFRAQSNIYDKALLQKRVND